VQGSFIAVLPAADQLTYALTQQFALHRDDIPPALLYLAVRAARRAAAVNPDDAGAYLVLGESYLRLLQCTRERVWAEQLPELLQLRRVQASAALNHAVSLKPDLAQAHLSLGRLYGDLGYLDLMLEHLRTYHKLIRKSGPPHGVSVEQFREQEAGYEEELRQLTNEVEKRENRYAVETAGRKVRDQAFQAQRSGLAGKARDLLLESDVAAFGTKGMALELELLLKTGRPRTVLEWMGPEQEAALGQQPYHWLRVQALAATGDYALGREECDHLSRSLAPHAGGQEPARFREIMALLIGRRVLEEQVGPVSLPELIRRTSDRFEFRNRIAGLAQSLRREADVTVLRGLLALEEGEIDEAEIAFRVALSYWKDADAAASGGGLEFNGRAVAQGCLEWLK
jgi:tetratricopeptide (TPR) repeat protein